MSRAGSPGTTRERKNVTSVTPHRTNTMNARRLAINVPWASPPHAVLSLPPSYPASYRAQPADDEARDKA
jgi:hypothetical protein